MNVIEAAEERLARIMNTAVILAVEEILRNAGTGYLLDMFCALHKEKDRAEFVRCLAGKGRKQMNEQAMDDLSDHLLWMSDLWNDIVEAVAAQIVEAETNSEEVEVPKW